MKRKVYCKNCKFYIYVNSDLYDGKYCDLGYENIMHICPKYKRKWYKFWIK